MEKHDQESGEEEAEKSLEEPELNYEIEEAMEEAMSHYQNDIGYHGKMEAKTARMANQREWRAWLGTAPAHKKVAMLPRKSAIPQQKPKKWAEPRKETSRPAGLMTFEERAELFRKAVAEEAEKKAQKEEIAAKKKEERWIALGQAICELSLSDFILSDSEDTSEPDDVATRGEEILSATTTFGRNVKALLGEPVVRGTIFADGCRFAANLMQVNMSSVAARHKSRRDKHIL
ncbi:unnamed protein product [Caenorhabditis sp. 36 PRJEB53466]|nr:unnamed protein product [Caenorhabditis sp. 36 PRJEB53466]